MNIQEVILKNEAREIFVKYFKTPVYKYGDNGEDFKVLPRLNKEYVVAYGNQRSIHLSNYGNGLYLLETK